MGKVTLGAFWHLGLAENKLSQIIYIQVGVQIIAPLQWDIFLTGNPF
jgi:hypothetical protein